ncbi:MAG: hypothetical protein HDS69_00600 [Bacteroidales bacterium]|nr:hypothetical protein [Bacteroidales bacterium]MBD5257920.1 hypothetical protein [Barnesiella sp.]
MAKKTVKPANAFWFTFCIAVLVPVVITVAIAASEDKMHRIFRQEGLLFLLDLVWMGAIAGSVAALIAWFGQRKKKMEERDEVNDLMRKYLEKKLREEMNDKGSL